MPDTAPLALSRPALLRVVVFLDTSSCASYTPLLLPGHTRVLPWHILLLPRNSLLIPRHTPNSKP